MNLRTQSRCWVDIKMWWWCASEWATLSDPLDYSQPGSSVRGILQARILERVAISSSRGSSRPGDWTCVSCIAGGFFTTAPPGKPWLKIVKCNCSDYRVIHGSSVKGWLNIVFCFIVISRSQSLSFSDAITITDFVWKMNYLLIIS